MLCKSYCAGAGCCTEVFRESGDAVLHLAEVSADKMPSCNGYCYKSKIFHLFLVISNKITIFVVQTQKHKRNGNCK